MNRRLVYSEVHFIWGSGNTGLLGLSTKVKAPLYSSFEAFYCRSKWRRRPQPTFQWSSQLPLASWFQSIPKPTTTILRLRQLINQRQYLCLEQLSSNKMRNIFCHGWYFAVKYINRRHSNAIAASSHRLNIVRLFNQQQWLITNYWLLSNTQWACLKLKFCKSECEMAMSPGLRSWHPLPPLPSSPHPRNRWRRPTSPLALPHPHLPTISTFHLELTHPATKSQPHRASSHSIHSRLAFGANDLGFCISDYSLHFGENGSHDCLQENTFE